MAHVLVVDDSVVSRDFVSDYLVRQGFEVRTAKDGRDGLDRLREDPSIRVVLSDVNMPVMDGLTMAEHIRRELGNQRVRIVMLTTEGNQAIRDRGKAAGVSGWIVKPFKGDAVVGQLKMLCGL